MTLSREQVPACAEAITDLYIRAAPNESAEAIAIIPQGGHVNLLNSDDTWWKISYTRTAGYASATYLRQGPCK
jgi:hypothetical protein